MDKLLRNSLLVLVFLAILYLGYNLLTPIDQVVKAVIGLISPFIVGFGLAFIFHPIVLWLIEKKVPSILARFIVIFIVFGVTILFIVNLLGPIFDQVVYTINIVPDLYDDLMRLISDSGLSTTSVNIESELNTLVIGVVGTTTELLHSFFVTISSSVDFMLFMPVLFIYFLFDYERVKGWVKKVLRVRKYDKFYSVMQEYEDELHSYVSGMMIILVIMTAVSYLSFELIGLNNALLFAVIIGITNIIPIIGNPIGGAIAALFALTQSVTMALLVIIIVAILTVLEGNVVTPMVQSNRVDLHPVLIILGIVIMGYVLGIFGMLLAIPIILFIRQLHSHYSIYGENYNK